ncbi:TPA: hypothetical protein VDW46_003197 [Pseudomonas aeruginosa]|nr:hypothetical protein [Pseudomonas aeruginosa]
MTIYTQDAPALDRRTLLDIPADTGDVFGAAFESAFSTNPSSSIVRMEELRQAEEGRGLTNDSDSIVVQPRLEPDTPLLSAEDARARVAESGLDIKVPDQGIRQGALDILIDRHRAQAARQQIMARAGSGTMPAQIAASLGASLLDPLNIASAFVPVVGEARYANMLARAASPLGRAGVRAGVGALEGAVGAAIIEPLPLLAAAQDQTDYGLSDSLANIALGGLLGGGLHTVGGAISDALKRRVVSELDTQPSVAAAIRPEPTARRQIDYGRLFDDDPDVALRQSLARGLEADQANLYQAARSQAIEEIRTSLVSERVGNVADLRAELTRLEARAQELPETFKARAKEFQGPRVSRKQAERMARDAIATEGEQISVRREQINAELERNRSGEMARQDIAALNRGEVPERLAGRVEARASQIMEGYRRSLGAAVKTARQVAEESDWTIRDAALRTAVSQAMTGRDIAVADLFDLQNPAKAAQAMDNLRRPQERRVDPEGAAESRRIDELKSTDDLEDARQALADDEALSREILDQLPEDQRAMVEAMGREEFALADAEAAKAEKYSKAYRAAALCEIGRG